MILQGDTLLKLKELLEQSKQIKQELKIEFYKMILQGDTLLKLKELLDNSIDMGVTSPPYNK